MYYKFILLTLFIVNGFCYSQNLSNVSFGTDDTFEVVTWNLEWFPKNGQETVDSVTKIIEALDVDVIACQEISDTVLFNQMIQNLTGYEANYESSYFAGLAYIYNPDSIQVVDIYEIYTTFPYWNAFPRSPQVMELLYKGEEIVIINNHLKCCGDGYLEITNSGDEENRRLEAMNLLKNYTDFYFTDKRVIILGDLNDVITDNSSNNVFQSFIDDVDYKFADENIANGSSSNWSYPGWPSHLDHILISSELFIELDHSVSTIETIKVDNHFQNGFSAYDDKVSDHRPVGLRLQIDPSFAKIYDNQLTEYSIINPVESTLYFFGHLPQEAVTIQIYTLDGKRLLIQENYSLSNPLLLNDLSSGVYVMKVSSLNQINTFKFTKN